MELLSVKRNFLFLSVGLVLVNCFILSDHVLQSTWGRSLLLSFYLGGSSGCEDVFSEIDLLDKIFKVLTKGATLRSLMSSAVMKGAVVLCFKTSRVVWFCIRVLYPGLTLWMASKTSLIVSFSGMNLSDTW